MRRFIPLVLLLLALSGEVIRIQAQPSNDLCANATDISTYPFIETGTLLNATTSDDDLLSACDAGGFYEWEDLQWWTYNDVWYKIQNVPEGAEIQVVISGTGRVAVDGWVIMSNNDEEGTNTTTTNTCPDKSNCVTPVDLVKLSSLSPTITNINDTAPTYLWIKSIKWPATKDSIYYLTVLAPQATTINGRISSSAADEEVVPTEFDLLVNYTLPSTPDNVDMNSSSYSPINDLCSSATEVTTFPYFEHGTLGNATKDVVASTCEGSSWNGTDVWYKISNVPDGARIDVGTSGFGSAHVVALAFVSSSNASCPSTDEAESTAAAAAAAAASSFCSRPEDELSMSVSSAEIDGSKSWGYSVYWNATKDTIYYLALFTYLETEIVPYFDLFIFVTPPAGTSDDSVVVSNGPPSNDDCASATHVSTFPFNESGTLVNATKNTLSSCISIPWEGNDVWYMIHDVPTGAGIRVDVGGQGRGVLQPYVVTSTDEGNCPYVSQCVEPNVTAMSSINGDLNWQSTVFWSATPGSIYYLAVYASDNSFSKEFDIYINYTYPPPINDYCDSATEITTFPFTDSGSLANATQDAYDTCAGGAAGWKGKDVWYKISNVPDGEVVEVDLSGRGATVVQIKPLISDDLGYCPDRSQCVEPLAIYASPTIDDATDAWNYSVAWPTTTSTIYYLAVYTEVENVGPKFELTVKLSDPYAPSSSTKSSLLSDASHASNVKHACLAASVLVGVVSGSLFI